MNVALLLVESLRKAGVKYVFGQLLPKLEAGANY